MTVDREALWAMQLFVEVISRGSLAEAARAQGITPSAVSKQIARLEERLGVRLLSRTTRSLAATAAGARYHEHAQQILAAVRAAEAEVIADKGDARGRLKVSAPTLLGQELIAPLCARFIDQHPGVEIALDLSDRFVDLVREGVDVALRVATGLPGSGLTMRRLGAFELVLVASPAYLRRRPPIEHPKDLEQHACLSVAHLEDRRTWRLSLGGRAMEVQVAGPLTSTSMRALHAAAREGAGIALVPLYMAAPDLASGRVARVLPQASMPRRTVHAVHASGRLAPARVRRFVDLLALELPRVLH